MKLLPVLAFLCGAATALGQMTLVPCGSVWRYYTAGPVPSDWVQPGVNDGWWPSGPAPLGYGDNDEATIIHQGPAEAPGTVYFRGTFIVTNWQAISSATLRLLADDGAVVYLNGVEIARRNLPAGAVTFATPAVVNLETNEHGFAQYGVDRWYLRANTNTLAVEIHQHPDGLQDCRFDLELLANLPIERPTIAITSPADGAVLEPDDLQIEVALHDSAGHITRVEFYTNSVYFGMATSEPFSWPWTNPPPGRYRITALACNNFTARRESPPVHAQIGPDTPLALRRGPYLQCGSPTNMIVRWRTDWFSDSVLRYGTNLAQLDHALSNATLSTEHEINITGLTADTLYFYAVGAGGTVLAGGTNCYFRTSPVEARPVRLWVVGDSGTANDHARIVRDAYYAITGPAHTDALLMVGDNTVGDGFDNDLQQAVFDMYDDFLRRTVAWPSLGNHDAGDAPDVFGNGAGPHCDIFSLPMQGEAGGLASGSELYYSFDYANAHVVCLDSYISDRSSNGPMLTWLQQDLAATDKDWILAYWHHPPYSWAEHNSDYETIEIEMRERVVPILEAYGVDLVICGHSHVYERSYLLNGHYGYSWELQPATMVLDSGSGCAASAGPYRKAAGGLGAHGGTVYAVCGCSGRGESGGMPTHPAMTVSLGGYGSMVVEINGLQLRARFLRPSTDIEDDFTLDKSMPTSVRPRVRIARSLQGAEVGWPTSNPAYTLECAETLSPTAWQNAGEPVRTNGRQNVVTIATNAANRFFRLRAAP